MPTQEQINDLIGYELPPPTYTYTPRDVSLYALGVGAPADPLNPDELKFVYELSSRGFVVLPSFAVIYQSGMIDMLLAGKLGTVEYNPLMLVHGEQSLEIKKPLPAEGTITSYPKISNIYDKGSGMLVITDVTSMDEHGEEVAFMQSSMFIRGMGGYGGEHGPSSKVNLPPEREPDIIHEEATTPNQALLYRLSGDRNPLHADPQMAEIGGFERPILHGLCTFGFAVRAVLKHYCANDPSIFKRVQVRFSKHVFPGETIITQMWQESEAGIIFQCKVKERDEIVLSNAAVTIQQTHPLD